MRAIADRNDPPLVHLVRGVLFCSGGFKKLGFPESRIRGAHVRVSRARARARVGVPCCHAYTCSVVRLFGWHSFDKFSTVVESVERVFDRCREVVDCKENVRPMLT